MDYDQTIEKMHHPENFTDTTNEDFCGCGKECGAEYLEMFVVCEDCR